MLINVITNGLLLTPEVVDRLLPFGLNGVKITLDGDRDTHNRMRPLRGGQGTFDKIIANVRQVADKCRISIGGNFDESSVDSYPGAARLPAEQEFAPTALPRSRSSRSSATSNASARQRAERAQQTLAAQVHRADAGRRRASRSTAPA